jgi:predicted ATPase
MRQSIEHNAYTHQLILNDSDGVSLGSFSDVKNQEISITEPIYFEFSIENEHSKNTIRYCLEYLESEPTVLHIQEITMQPCAFVKSDFPSKYRFHHYLTDAREAGVYQIQDDDRKNNYVRLYKLAPLLYVEGTKLQSGDDLSLEKIHYVSADRIGPRSFHNPKNFHGFLHVGASGENTVHLLYKMAQELVNEQLCLGEDAKTLITQTEAWLGRILSPLSLKVNPLRGNILELLIGDFQPGNVGFGYSSILPIIVSGLIAKPGEKLIIENPEIHLHPKAQIELIQFLVAVANTGVQIFIESHSDHVLNGIRVAVKEAQISQNEVSIFFHDRFNAERDVRVTSIKLDKQGELSEYPENFFDEYSNQLFKLV